MNVNGDHILVGLSKEEFPVRDAPNHAPRKDQVKLLPPKPLLLDVVDLELAVRRYAAPVLVTRPST